MAEKNEKNSNDRSSEQPQARQDESRREDKVGGDRQAAEKIGGKLDFGIPASEAAPRDYRPHNPQHPSIEDQADDHRAIGPKGTGQRTRGVGTEDRGKPGRGSGGDVDTDVIGIGDGVGVAASGEIHEPPGPDDVSSAQPTTPPAEGQTSRKRGKAGNNRRVKGGTVHDRAPDTAGDQGT